MIRKHSITIGIIISLILLVIATTRYPGGSQHDKNAIGFDWKNNYLCNLFTEKAVNGVHNTSRLWAISGMFFLCFSLALFFFEFSKKIAGKNAARVIRYCGIAAMVFSIFVVTPLHDTAITCAGALALLSMFYIILFVFKSKLHLFKMLCVVFLVIAYTCNYVYYTGNYIGSLPVLQKAYLGIALILILCLQYFTTASDFKSRENVALKTGGMSTNR